MATFTCLYALSVICWVDWSSRRQRITRDPVLDDLLRRDSEVVQACKVLQALIKLVHNRILDRWAISGRQNTIPTVKLAYHGQGPLCYRAKSS